MNDFYVEDFDSEITIMLISAESQEIMYNLAHSSKHSLWSI